MRITYHVAASEDGFIAAENGDIAWLEDADIDVAETGLVEFMTRIDGMVMGRRTYDFIVDYGSWPYGVTPAWVCTTNEIVRLDGAILTTAKSVREVLRQSTEQGLRDMWLVGGGELASSFLDQKLITDICVTQLPVRLGQGIPLFSRHRLTDLTSQSEKRTNKPGFQLIEMQLAQR